MITLQLNEAQAALIKRAIIEHTNYKLKVVRESREDGDHAYSDRLMAEVDVLDDLLESLSKE